MRSVWQSPKAFQRWCPFHANLFPCSPEHVAAGIPCFDILITYRVGYAGHVFIQLFPIVSPWIHGRQYQPVCIEEFSFGGHGFSLRLNAIGEPIEKDPEGSFFMGSITDRNPHLIAMHLNTSCLCFLRFSLSLAFFLPVTSCKCSTHNRRVHL